MSDETATYPDEDPVVGKVETLEGLRVELERVRAQRDGYRDALQSHEVDSLREFQVKLSHLSDQVDRMERRSFRLPSQLLSDSQSLIQLIERFRPKVTLPVLSGWALSPSGLLALTDLVAESNTGSVVECGSGTSTLWLAYAIRQKGAGRVLALEHDRSYALRTQGLLRKHDLEDFAEVRYAPLVPHSTDRGEFKWYDIGSADIDDAIEILVVDGPPGDTNPYARYPAFSLLKNRLLDQSLIILDDTNRQEERQVTEYWLAEDSSLSRVDFSVEAMELFSYSNKGG